MSPEVIRFGTDGWRGVVGREFTFANVRRVAAAIAAHLEEQGTAGRGVAVGYDRRFLSEGFAAEVAGVLAARGVPVLLADAHLPTPALSWGVREQGLAGGIMVTASHNPYEWNGVKFKEPFGGSARAVTNAAVETLLDREFPDGESIPCLPLDEARRRDGVAGFEWWAGYAEGVRRFVDLDAIRAGRLAVGVDAMHGSGSPWLRRLLEEAGCRVLELHASWNPAFGGRSPEPIEENLRGLSALVTAEGLALGLANDGDADRIGAVDERGRFFSPQRILAVFLRYLREEKGLDGAVVRAVSATSLLDLLAAQYGLETVLTPVGFKHAGEVMLQRPVLLGGEESGGIGIGAHLPERDGILNALVLAELVARTGKGLRGYLQEVFDRVGHFTYRRLDLSLDPAGIARVRERIAALDPPQTLAGRPVREVITLDGTKFVRDDHSWLLLRPSGTEPLVRVYAEARSGAEVQELIDEGRRLLGE
ncbi:MAG TPA: phosphoglucomutase/phosphomannomutase family protein [Deferrisomatales bacterium]|nr:phosphoglucomutase/phosphomannomutase family protein [Deferrisomatales bacterium]